MDDASERSDEDLAAAAQSAMPRPLICWWVRYLRSAMALAQQTLRVEDAEDVVQEAFHRAVGRAKELCR